MISLLLLIAHVVIVGALVVRVLLRPRRDPASRVAWILFIVGLPVIGSIAYLLLGEVHSGRDVNGEVELSRDLEREVVDVARTLNIPEHAIAAFRTAGSVSGFLPAGGNDAHLLEDSNTTIEAMIADIDAATDHVHLLFYIWLPDDNGGKMADALVRATSRGVTCRAIVDDLGSRAFVRSEHWSRMQKAGVHLARALPIRQALRRLMSGRLDVRNHRKIVVVDDSITFCGSQNCADPEFLPKAKYAPWVDAVVRFEGPVARQNQQLFLEDWANATGERVAGLLDRPLPAAAGRVIAQALGTGPDIRYSAMPELFATLMHAARHELVISTPYFVPDEAMQAALCASARRGVATTIVFPAKNDSPFVAAASRSYYGELLAAGVIIREYTGGLLHTKTLTLDGETSLIGSANMDRRSFELNYENNILLHDATLTGALRDRQDSYIAASREVTRNEVAAWRWTYRLRNNFVAILGPVL